MAGNVALRTSKNTLMLLSGTLARMLFSFFFVIYAATALGVQLFGVFSLASHFFELFLSLSATAIGIVVTRDIARWSRQLSQLLSSALVLAILLAAVAAAGMLALSWSLSYSPLTVQAIRVGAIALFPASVCVVFEAAFVARQRAELVAFGTTLESLLRTGLGFAALWQGMSILALLWILVAVRIALLVVYGIALRQLVQSPWHFSPRRFLRLARRWRVFAAENWMATIYTNLDVLVLSALMGEVAVGLYSASWKIVRLGVVFAKSYTTAVFPVMSQMFDKSRSSFYRLSRDTIRFMCALALPMIAVVSVLTERIILLLYDAEYLPAVPVLRVLIWVLLLEFLNPFLSHALFAQRKPQHSMYVAAISLVTNSVATVALVASYGVIGAAVGTVIGGFVATCCYALFALQRSELLATAAVTCRVLLAAAGMGVTLFLIREQTWLLLAAIGITVYAALLWLLKAVHREDFALLRSTFLARNTV